MQQFVSNLKTFLKHLARTFQIETPLRYNVFILRLAFPLVLLIVKGIDNVSFCFANSFETLKSTCHVAWLTTNRITEQTRVLSRIYHLGEKSLVAEGDKPLRGVRPLPPPPATPRNFSEMNMR